MLSFRKSWWANSKKTYGQTEGQTDERTEGQGSKKLLKINQVFFLFFFKKKVLYLQGVYPTEISPKSEI